MERWGSAGASGRGSPLAVGPTQLVAVLPQPDMAAGRTRCYHASHGLPDLPVVPAIPPAAADKVFRLMECCHDILPVSYLSVPGKVTLKFQQIHKFRTLQNRKLLFHI